MSRRYAVKDNALERAVSAALRQRHPHAPESRSKKPLFIFVYSLHHHEGATSQSSFIRALYIPPSEAGMYYVYTVEQ